MSYGQARHTKIEKEIVTSLGTVILEHPNGYPRHESNLYCMASNGKIVWFAERPGENVHYTRVRLDEQSERLLTYSTRDHACEIDPRTGKLLSTLSIA